MIDTLIIVSGLLAGYLLRYIAREEIKPGRYYFRLLECLLISIVAALSIISLDFLTLLFAVLLYIVSYFRLDPIVKYIFVALVYVAAPASPVYSGMLFMFGFPAASLEKNSIKTLAAAAIFLCITMTQAYIQYLL